LRWTWASRVGETGRFGECVPLQQPNRTVYTDDPDHSRGVIDDARMLKREPKQCRDNQLRCTQDWKSCIRRLSRRKLLHDESALRGPVDEGGGRPSRRSAMGA
jgi:hypothetical protein